MDDNIIRISPKPLHIIIFVAKLLSVCKFMSRDSCTFIKGIHHSPILSDRKLKPAAYYNLCCSAIKCV